MVRCVAAAADCTKLGSGASGSGGMDHTPGSELATARCRATDNTLHQRRAQPRAAKARKGGGARWMRGYGRIAGTRRPTDPTMWVCERQGQPMKALHCDVHEVGCKSRRCIRRNYRNPHTGMEKGSSGRSKVVPQQWLSPRKSTPTTVCCDAMLAAS